MEYTRLPAPCLSGTLMLGFDAPTGTEDDPETIYGMDIE